MNKIVTFLVINLVCFVAFNVRAQNQNNALDHRLVEMYGAEAIAKMEAEQPQTLAYLNYYIQNGYQILTDVPAYKVATFKDISTITNKVTQKPLTPQDIAQLNILMLDIVRKNDQYLTYKIGDTGLVIVFIAPKNVLLEYEIYKQTLK